MKPTCIYEPFNPVFSQVNMKPAEFWIPGAEFQPVTHLSQANTCLQGARDRAAVVIAADPLNDGIPQTNPFAAGPGIVATHWFQPKPLFHHRIRGRVYGECRVISSNRIIE